MNAIKDNQKDNQKSNSDKFMCFNCRIEKGFYSGELCEFCMQEIDETDMRDCGDK